MEFLRGMEREEAFLMWASSWEQQGAICFSFRQVKKGLLVLHAFPMAHLGVSELKIPILQNGQ